MRSYWIYFLISVGMIVGALSLSYVMINGFEGGPITTNRAAPLTFSPSTFDNAELLLNVKNDDLPEVHQFAVTLRTILQEHNVNVRSWPNGELDDLLAIEKMNITHYHERICGAIQLDGFENRVVVKLLFPGNWLHSSAALMNLMDNVMGRMDDSRVAVDTVNVPILKQSESSTSGGDFEVYKMLMPMC